MFSSETDKTFSGDEAVKRYVELLTGCPHGALAFRTICDDKTRKSEARNLSGTLEGLRDDFEQAQADGHGVFAVVNAGGHRDADVTEVRAVFVDADGVALDRVEWHVKPDFLVIRDGTHWHAYWIANGIAVSDFRALQKRLAEHYGTDPNVCNPSRVMRLPGYLHLKDPSNPKPVTLIDFTGGTLGNIYRELNGHTIETISKGLREAATSTQHASIGSVAGPSITLEKFRAILSFIDPTMEGEHQKWAGMTLAILHGQIPVVDPQTIDWTQLADDFNSGELWRQRTGDQSFVVSTYQSQEEMLKSAAGNLRETGPLIALGTFVQMARAGGFVGPVVDEMARFDMVGETTSAATHAETQPNVYPSYFVKELEALPEPRWLIEGLIPEDALSIFYGATNSLKTFFALDILLAGATEKKWAEGEAGSNLTGFKIPRPLRCVIIAGEGARGLSKRIRARQKKHNAEHLDPAVVVIPTMPRFGNREDISKLILTIHNKLGKVDLVVVDTAMRAASNLNLNVPVESQILIDACERIRLELETSVVLIHHTGKDEEKGPLGAENLKAAVNTVERIKLIDSAPGKRTISVTQEKSKDSDLREPLYFNATNEVIGTDSSGNEISSLVLSRSAPPTAAKVSTDAIRLRIALEIIREHGGETGISMHELVERMAQKLALEPQSSEAIKKLAEVLRKWVEAQIRPGERLQPYAFRDGAGKKAPWRFRDRAFVLPPLAAE